MEKAIEQADKVIILSSVAEFQTQASNMLFKIGSTMLVNTGYYSAVVKGVKTLWILA